MMPVDVGLGPGTLRAVGIEHPAARPLFDGLAHEYRRCYGDLLDRELGAYAADEFEAPEGQFLLLHVGGRTVAGGGFRRLEEGVAEIKRMWTDPAHRGRGHGRQILMELEAAAAARGYESARLETGAHQAAAIRLYRRMGYHEIEPYGEYRSDPRCRAFEKRLAATRASLDLRGPRLTQAGLA
jgi:ribosomal protein S18 acetylase RimI-like enzyme